MTSWLAKAGAALGILVILGSITAGILISVQHGQLNQLQPVTAVRASGPPSSTPPPSSPGGSTSATPGPTATVTPSPSATPTPTGAPAGGAQRGGAMPGGAVTPTPTCTDDDDDDAASVVGFFSPGPGKSGGPRDCRPDDD